MDSNTLELLEVVGDQHATNEQEELQKATRELMDAELLFVGGGGGDVIW